MAVFLAMVYIWNHGWIEINLVVFILGMLSQSTGPIALELTGSIENKRQESEKERERQRERERERKRI